MRLSCGSVLRSGGFALALLACAASIAEAQAFGIGGRYAVVRGDEDTGTPSENFWGGQIRLGLSRRLAVELALDHHSEEDETLNLRVSDTPLQASLLLYLGRGSLSPYLLGGVGWYWKRVEPIDGPDLFEPESTRRFGSHAGFGAEIRLGSHAGLHGDYRYTFLDFDSDDDDSESSSIAAALLPGVSKLLPSHEGSMWTVGLSIYF
jgi:hypothetical protein